MSKIFIDRPIFAWVIAIIIMLVGHRRDHLAAGRAISRRRTDPDQHPRELSRRIGGNARKQRDAGAGAAADRHRRDALFLIVVDRARIGVDQRHPQQGRRSRHRPGPGPERDPDRDLAPAAAGAAARRPGQQGLARPAADRRHLRQDRQEHQFRRVGLADDQHAGRAVAHSRRRRRQRVRLILRDAHLARPAQARRASA